MPKVSIDDLRRRVRAAATGQGEPVDENVWAKWYHAELRRNAAGSLRDFFVRNPPTEENYSELPELADKQARKREYPNDHI